MLARIAVSKLPPPAAAGAATAGAATDATAGAATTAAGIAATVVPHEGTWASPSPRKLYLDDLVIRNLRGCHT